jgi:hypothetical protein
MNCLEESGKLLEGVYDGLNIYLFIYLFIVIDGRMLSVTQNVLQNDRLISKNKLVRMWKEAVVAYLMLLPLYLCRRTM